MRFKANKKQLQIVSIMVLALVVTLSYQNCSSLTDFTVSQNAEKRSSEGGGGSYDGKLRPGTYVRHHPTGCSVAGPESHVIGTMQIGTSGARITNDLCTALDYPFALTDSRFQFSAYNLDFVGFNAAIFEYQASPVARDRAERVDLWCRFDDGNRGLDLVVKSGLDGSSPQALVYGGRNLMSQAPIIDPRRVFSAVKADSPQRLSVTTTDSDLVAEVDLTNRTASGFAGRLRMTNNGEPVDVATSCRVLSTEPAIYSQPSQLIGLYQFEDRVGTVPNGSSVVDSTSFGNAGAFSSADGLGGALMAGPKGNALALDGIDDHVDLSRISQLVTDTATVSLWLKRDVVDDVDAVAFAIHDAGGRTRIKIGTGMCPGVADGRRLGFDIGTTCTDTGQTIVDGRWHQVTLVMSAGVVTVYLDGLQVSQQPFAYVSNPTDKWTLGLDWDGASGGDKWTGLVDEVVVWRAALTPADVSQSFR